jgi:hypothetical protein
VPFGYARGRLRMPGSQIEMKSLACKDLKDAEINRMLIFAKQVE